MSRDLHPAKKKTFDLLQLCS